MRVTNTLEQIIADQRRTVDFFTNVRWCPSRFNCNHVNTSDCFPTKRTTVSVIRIRP